MSIYVTLVERKSNFMKIIEIIGQRFTLFNESLQFETILVDRFRNGAVCVSIIEFRPYTVLVVIIRQSDTER